MIPKFPVFNGDERLDDPIVFVGDIIRSAVDIAFAETDAHHFARCIAQNQPARVILRAAVIP